MNRLALEIADLSSLSPLVTLLMGALGLLLIEAFSEKLSKKYSFYFTMITLVFAFFDTYQTKISTNELITRWVVVDNISQTFTYFFLAIGLGTVLLTKSFFSSIVVTCGEFYFLVLASLFGLILIASSADFLPLFLGLETLSLSLYILCTYVKKWKISHEAAIKYFLLGSIGAAFLLYGIALTYGAIGDTRFDLLLTNYHLIDNTADKFLFNAGMAFVTVGFLFKAAAVPFHIWAPDVYAGSPTPVTAFMSVATKVGAFAAFTRVFLVELPNWNSIWNEGIAIISIITILYANYVAIQQKQLRRFFAYSGISHSGFALIPIAAGGEGAIYALLFYLAVYSFATLGCFSVLCSLDVLKNLENNDGIVLDDLKGLFYRSPFLAIIFSIFLMTLGGIPPTVGFLSKFFLFKIALDSGFYTLTIIALFTTILSAFFYLRFIAIMLRDQNEEKETKLSPAIVVLGSVCVLGIVWFSINPQLLLYLIEL